MPRFYAQLRFRLGQAGLLPVSKLALVAWFLFALDLFLFGLQKLLAVFKSSYGDSLAGWVSFLSFAVIVLFAVLAIRWLRTKILWRLRNRLVVTYVFIGVIPVVLLAVLALGSFYLFAGQLAAFIVTTGIESEQRSLEAGNAATARALSASLQARSEESLAAATFDEHNAFLAHRQLCVWLDHKMILNASPPGLAPNVPVLPAYLEGSFRGIVREHGRLFLRVAQEVPSRGGVLMVLSSEPLDQRLLQNLAANLGEITLYASGITLKQTNDTQARGYVIETANDLTPAATAGTVPLATRFFDRQVTFPTSLAVIDWETGRGSDPAVISVETRASKLYERLFASLGDFAPAVEFVLLLITILFGVIELAALLIGVRLTGTITGAVAQLYDATRHINRGDFSHRISVSSNDQLAALATSFNSMTASLEKLILEQKEKQRMENELVIAQEVQAQLFPRHVSQLATLEVFGFCRPARTVSGDYYDFLAIESDKLLLAVGDISGKGISAALLMATVHSAVRAYSLEGIPILREPVAVGAGLGSSMELDSPQRGPEVSPGGLLALLNHQLYQSTPSEKYATLFLGLYDETRRTLTYSNGGHLPPIILGNNDSIHKLHQGGTVVGLFDARSYDEASVALREGDIFLAYSDGVTEPENEFGEFGEHRLIELVQENRDLPLARICEIVTAAVDDWIGANEQPDDVTLVLARAR